MQGGDIFMFFFNCAMSRIKEFLAMRADLNTYSFETLQSAAETLNLIYGDKPQGDMAYFLTSLADIARQKGIDTRPDWIAQKRAAEQAEIKSKINEVSTRV